MGPEVLAADNSTARCEDDVMEEDVLASLDLDPISCGNMIKWLSEYSQVISSRIKFDSGYTQHLREFENIMSKVEAIRKSRKTANSLTLQGLGGTSSSDSFQLLSALPVEGFVYTEIRPVEENLIDLVLGNSVAVSNPLVATSSSPLAVSAAHKGYPVYIRLLEPWKAATRRHSTNSDASHLIADQHIAAKGGGSVLFFERGPRTPATLRADFTALSSVVILDCSYVRDFQLDITNVLVLDQNATPASAKSPQQHVVVRLRFSVASDYWLWAMAIGKLCGGRVTLAGGSASSTTTSALFGSLQVLAAQSQVISAIDSDSGRAVDSALSRDGSAFMRKSNLDQQQDPAHYAPLGGNSSHTRRGGEWSRFSLHFGVTLLSVIADQRLIQETRRQYEIQGAQLQTSSFTELNSRVVVSAPGATRLLPGSVVVSLGGVSATSVGAASFIKLLQEVPAESTHRVTTWKFPRSEYGVEVRVADLKKYTTLSASSIVEKEETESVGEGNHGRDLWMECTLVITSSSVILQALRKNLDSEDYTTDLLHMQLSRVKLRLLQATANSHPTRGSIGTLSLCLELKEARAEEGKGNGSKIAIAVPDFSRGFEMLEHLMLALRLIVGPTAELATMLDRSNHWLRTGEEACSGAAEEDLGDDNDDNENQSREANEVKALSFTMYIVCINSLYILDRDCKHRSKQHWKAEVRGCRVL